MIKKIRKNIVCNSGVCGGNIADYEIDIKKRKSTVKVFLCNECFKNLYFEMGRFVAPKSPQNILNKFKN